MKVSATMFAVLLSLSSAVAFGSNVNDAQIASIVLTANQVDIDAGAYMSSRSKNAEVRKFAALMVSDHTGVNQAAIELATRLRLVPENNATSESLKAAGDTNLVALKALKGRALDKAYIDHEVAYHQQVIDALDTVLIPGATNAELKALLVKVRPAFIAHLEHAKHLQAAIGGRR